METASLGKPTVSRTMTRVTRPACGIPAAPILAAVAVIEIMITWKIEICKKVPQKMAETCQKVPQKIGNICHKVQPKIGRHHHLSNRRVHPGHLCDEDCSNCLIEGCAVHVDCCPNGQHKTGDSGVNLVALGKNNFMNM